ncbi:MAG: hypothetical protein A2666_04900 [Parcubacteria group bacterium RIFCSPHIGHO2_01_FULL_47_10b]|nr:MAG: hypothetical protein A2666_04900 [Parcubacteria group bacterium RIFCSPHIGHO2_01_FULL_47_10b]
MAVIGGKATSPKAARGVSGIRKDIDDETCFYSRWEANIARVFNFERIAWVHQPQRFSLGSHTYTPDFFLPDRGVYVEVKNYWNAYSLERDTKFRALYPNIPLRVISKKEYMKLQSLYAKDIKNWEYINSDWPESV